MKNNNTPGINRNSPKNSPRTRANNNVSPIRDAKKQGTVIDIVNKQEVTNDFLYRILNKIGDLGATPSTGFSKQTPRQSRSSTSRQSTSRRPQSRPSNQVENTGFKSKISDFVESPHPPQRRTTTSRSIVQNTPEVPKNRTSTTRVSRTGSRPNIARYINESSYYRERDNRPSSTQNIGDSFSKLPSQKHKTQESSSTTKFINNEALPKRRRSKRRDIENTSQRKSSERTYKTATNPTSFSFNDFFYRDAKGLDNNQESNNDNGFMSKLLSSKMADAFGKSEWGSKVSGFLSNIQGSSAISGEASKAISSKGAGGGAGMIALQIINKVLEAMRGALTVINDTVAGGISQNIANQKQYLGPVSARLQSFQGNSTTAYKELSKEIRNVFTNSRYVNQQELLKNIAQLVQEGVGYNLEDRAYLATIADRTVATFEILNNSTLNRMIRLQQADLTRPQMGAEAFLTKFLNEYYQDTSYLTDMYDNVTGMLMDAISQMSFDQTTGFLFNVQKWMAALYSVGMSDNAINTIVQGLNYLGSGNVNQLTSNNQLNTLFAMSAQQAGLSYSNLLTYGLSDQNVDKLLNAMVKYLQDIANNTNSEILRSEYGRVFGGMSVADLRAVQNLTNSDMLQLTKSTTQMTYEKALEEAGKQIKAVKERTSTAEQIENMFNNLIYSIGAEIGEDEDAYMTWFYSDIAEQFGDYLGGIVPGIIGSIISNGVGAIAEAVKTGQVIEAIKDIDMFKSYEWADLVEDAQGTDLEGLANFTDTLANSDVFYWLQKTFGTGMTLRDTINLANGASSIATGVQNWEYYSQLGATDSFLFDNWEATTKRADNFIPSISLGDSAFSSNKAKIKQEEITGIDDTLTKSIDTLYDSLFGENTRPIKVIIVDEKGGVKKDTIYQPQTDFEDSIYKPFSPQTFFSEKQDAQLID